MRKAKMTPEGIRSAAKGAASRKQILDRLQVALSYKNYDRLERIAILENIEIPPTRRHGIVKGSASSSQSARECEIPSVLHDKEALIEAISVSSNRGEVLERMGLSRNSRSSLKKALEVHGLEPPKRNSKYNLTKKAEQYLVKRNVRTDGAVIKEILFGLDLLPEECSECGIGTVHDGRPLVLQLDHINGDSTDNRLENLRILCPNCHSQTDTFSGRNKKYKQ